MMFIRDSSLKRQIFPLLLSAGFVPLLGVLGGVCQTNSGLNIPNPLVPFMTQMHFDSPTKILSVYPFCIRRKRNRQRCSPRVANSAAIFTLLLRSPCVTLWLGVTTCWQAFKSFLQLLPCVFHHTST